MTRIRSAACALALLLMLALSSCSALTVGGFAAGGGLAGSLLGPIGTGAGAFVGGGVGKLIDDNGRLEKERNEARAEAAAARADVNNARNEHAAIDAQLADLKRRIDAVPTAPAADPRVIYAQPKTPPAEENWLDQTPFRWLLSRFRRTQ